MVQHTSAIAKSSVAQKGPAATRTVVDSSSASGAARAARKMLRPLKDQIVQLLGQLVYKKTRLLFLPTALIFGPR